MLMRVGGNWRALRWRRIGVLMLALCLSGGRRRWRMFALLGAWTVRLTMLSRHGAHHAIVMGAMHAMAHAGAAAEAKRQSQHRS